MKQPTSQSQYRKDMMSGLSSRNILGHLALKKKKEKKNAYGFEKFQPTEDFKDNEQLYIFN